MKRLHESSFGVPFSCTCGTRDPRLVHVHDAYDCSSTQKIRKASGRPYLWASALVRKAVRDAAAAAAAAAAGAEVVNSNSVQFKLKFGIGASAAAVEAPAPVPALEPKGFVGSPNYSTSGTTVTTNTDGDDHLHSRRTPFLVDADDSVGVGPSPGPGVAMSDQAVDGFQFSMPPLEEYEKLLLEYPSLDPLLDDHCKITSDGTWCPHENSSPHPTDSSFILEELESIPSPAAAGIPVTDNIRVGDELISSCAFPDRLDTGQDLGIGGSEQRGLEIVNRLKYCALAISKGEVATAHQHVQRLEQIMSPTGSSIERVATYFTEALSAKLDQGSNGCSNGSNFSFNHRNGVRPSSNFKQACFKLACQEFDRWCPYLKFSHFTANQAILEAFEGEENLHILDLDVRQGLQWPSLLKELSLRSKGPPRVRMTVVVGVTPADLAMEDVQATMQRILDFADTLDLPLAYNILNMSVEDLLPETVNVKEGEVLAVNCVSSLYRRLVHRYPSSSLNNFLYKIRRLTPSVVTVVEGSANHDEDFYERFNGALQYYCSMFDSLAASGLARMPVEREMVERFLLGADITTLVLREGLPFSDDGHRSASSGKHPISADYWIQQMSKVGFRLRPISSFSFSQAWLLLWRTEYQGSNYSLMKHNDGCLSLGWAATPLYWVSSWCWC